ncbi:exported hypothetical protein [Nitrospira defluvii]|uniref:Secreted protein n=1 Tax=Nitrospira defluvii TaxID=330214 RepID=A0ABM8S2I0_9BACT|nr:exported hypothetical protein [Nitrospira defluvii]
MPQPVVAHLFPYVLLLLSHPPTSANAAVPAPRVAPVVLLSDPGKPDGTLHCAGRPVKNGDFHNIVRVLSDLC